MSNSVRPLGLLGVAARSEAPSELGENAAPWDGARPQPHEHVVDDVRRLAHDALVGLGRESAAEFVRFFADLRPDRGRPAFVKALRVAGRSGRRFSRLENGLEDGEERLRLLVRLPERAPLERLEKAGVLYGRYWGCFEDFKFLHFNVCYYAGIEHCIERGLTRFEPGAGGEYKWLRGFDPALTRSMHFLAHPGFAKAVGDFLKRERREVASWIEECRERSQLKPPPPSDAEVE